jgi:hypothetical protein
MGLKVRVYWNLHKKCWSVQDGKSGLVVDHGQYVVMHDVSFIVRKGGRERVLREGKKNVHAFACGTLKRIEEKKKGRLTPKELLKNPYRKEVTYNPYIYNSFVWKKTGKPVTNSSSVIMVGGRVFASMDEELERIYSKVDAIKGEQVS